MLKSFSVSSQSILRSLRALMVLATEGMTAVVAEDGETEGGGVCWKTRMEEAWREAVEWWSNVYKVTWADQPQNVYNLMAIGISFIVVVASFIVGSRHITRSMEEDARIAAAVSAAAASPADASREEEEGGVGDASATEEEGKPKEEKKPAKKKAAKTGGSKARGRSTERKAEDAEPQKRSTRARSSSRASGAPSSPARSEPKSGKGWENPMVLYLNIVVKNSSSIVEDSIEKRTGRGILSQMMYHIASLIIHDTAVTDRVATACLEGLEATLKGEHSLQVEVTKRGVWGNYFVLEVRLVGVPHDAVSKSKGLLVGSMINLFRVTACSDASYTNAMVFRNAERLLQQRLPSEIAQKLAENGVDADVVIKSDKKEQELYQTVMMHQASQEEDSDDESDDWSFESDYVFVNRSDAIIDEGSAVPTLTR
ncbi:hypothetical protein FOZ61_009548 [Perkinsus olseni]|uniref:Uncharacterized protein n=1 Tax=Perkinsus olseni TaxID=32597 RepID=A0A7J6M4Z0_PEROL|nr:hypothetical protein FOZ61_009548 [Perkinsus olseni]